MSNFEFVFSLLVIILGLGLTAIFSGFARVTKARPKVQIGWATGLLATWTTIRTVMFWRLIWRTRDTLPDASITLLAGALICGLYYFACALVFPDSLEGRTGLDEYFRAGESKSDRSAIGRHGFGLFASADGAGLGIVELHEMVRLAGTCDHL